MQNVRRLDERDEAREENAFVFYSLRRVLWGKKNKVVQEGVLLLLEPFV
jgi:hypothetical protein